MMIGFKLNRLCFGDVVLLDKTNKEKKRKYYFNKKNKREKYFLRIYLKSLNKLSRKLNKTYNRNR